MNHKKVSVVLVSLTLAVALVACSAQPPTPTLEVPSATLAPPTDTPVPTDTLAPTDTPVPTNTATATQAPPSATPTQAASPTPGEITRSGMITQDETWSGVVHLTGDVIVKPPQKLTILPGTKVLFAAHQDDQRSGVAVPLDDWIARHNDPTWTLEYNETHVRLDVYGTLIAKGTPENPILFTSDSPEPDEGDWVHVHIGHRSIVEYCILEYSRGGLDVMSGTGDTVTISHNIMRHNLWTGLTIHSSSPTVTYNEIYHSGGHQAIAVVGEGSAPRIAFNTLRDNKGGINVSSGTAPIVENNTLIDNDAGIGVLDSISAIIRGNIITTPNGAHDGFSYMHQPVYPTHAQQGQYSEITCLTIMDSSPLVVDNQLTQCPKGIEIGGDSSPEIRRNTIAGSITVGVFFGESFSGSPTIRENNLYDQSSSACSMSTQPIDMSENWWGTADAEKVAQTICREGPIQYEPFLKEPVELP